MSDIDFLSESNSGYCPKPGPSTSTDTYIVLPNQIHFTNSVDFNKSIKNKDFVWAKKLATC